MTSPLPPLLFALRIHRKQAEKDSERLHQLVYVSLKQAVQRLLDSFASAEWSTSIAIAYDAFDIPLQQAIFELLPPTNHTLNDLTGTASTPCDSVRLMKDHLSYCHERSSDLHCCTS
jgi:hypothetical protein